MQQKSYNIELLRAMSFVMVIIIHVANCFCRAYEFISTGEYLFSLTLNTLSRVSVPCFFMISGALLLGRNEPMKKSLKRALRFFMSIDPDKLSIIFYNDSSGRKWKPAIERICKESS